MARLLLKWKSFTRRDLTSSHRKPQFLNPLLDLESGSIGDSVHRPYDFGTFPFPRTSHRGKRFAG